PAPPESVDPVADPPTDAAREVVSPAESGIHIMVMQAVPRNGGEAEHVTIEAFRRLLMLELDALPGIIVHDAEYDADAALPGGRTSRVVITALSEAVDLPTAPGEARVNAAIAFRGEAQPAYMGLTFIINAAGAKQGVNCEVRVRM